MSDTENSQAIDLVIPALNPEVNWVSNTIERLESLQKNAGLEINLIVVDDGSSDKDQFDHISNAKKNVTVVTFESNQGKGAALRAGFEHSMQDLVLFTDADFPYEEESMVAVIDELRAGADVVLGYRETDYYASVPWFRKGISEAFRFVLKSLLRFPITDTQCGLKGMNAKGRSVFLGTSINEFLIDMEFIKRCVRRKDIDLRTVVVHLRSDVTFSSMGAGILVKELLNFVRILVK